MAMLDFYPRPWRITRHTRHYQVEDAAGRIIGVFWFMDVIAGVADRYPSEEQAREAAQAFARLSR